MNRIIRIAVESFGLVVIAYGFWLAWQPLCYLFVGVSLLTSTWLLERTHVDSGSN